MYRPSGPPPAHTIVEYFYPPDTGHRCGYCKSPDTNFSNGMWAVAMSVENYENLINIGWRRSGCYVYRPMNEKVCCPMYTIRNVSGRAEVSRSQRKVLKRFRKFIVDGVVPEKGKHEKSEPMHHENVDEVVDKKKEQSSDDLDRMADNVIEHSDTEVVDDGTSHKKSSDVSGASTSTTVQPNNNPPEKKPHPLKKKHLRRERKRQKLLAKGLDPDEFFRRNERNRVTELAGFFDFDGVECKHGFSTKLVAVDGPEFESVFEEEHRVYRKYQMHTHGDSEHECRASQFKRFLCENPFGDESEVSGGIIARGTFHQHYYIDSKLVAVGVIDILPSCVSSVYFFYDPEYNFLHPGTLGALHEMSFVNSLTAKDPCLKYYYLGFYIHSCVKMRYKRQFRPCQLVCPVTLRWVDVDQRVIHILDSVGGGFAKLDEREGETRQDEDVESLLLLYKRKVHEYGAYPHRVRDKPELQTFVNLVTSRVASNLLLYRSSTK